MVSKVVILWLPLLPEVDDAFKGIGLERCPANQGPVYIGLAQQGIHVPELTLPPYNILTASNTFLNTKQIPTNYAS